MAVRHVLQGVEERLRGRHEPHVRSHRFDDDARRVVCVLFEPRRQRVRVVVREDRRQPGDCLRHARRIAEAERRDAAPGLHEQAVAVAVVAAIELHDDIAAGRGTREPDRRHRRLGAGVHEAHALEPRRLRHQLPEVDLARRERAEGGPALRGTFDRRDNLRVRVTQDERPERRHVVDVARALGVVDVRARRRARSAPARRPPSGTSGRGCLRRRERACAPPRGLMR